MKLSSAYLYEQLEKEFEIEKSGGTICGISGADGYLRPFFYEEDAPCLEGHVYVADVSDRDGRIGEALQKAMQTAGREKKILWMICGARREQKERTDTDVPQLWLGMSLAKGKAASGIEVMNALQRVFDACGDWERDMERLCRKNSSVTELLKRSVPFLGNPLLVMGLDFSLDGEAGTELLPEQAKLYHDGMMDVEYMNAMMQDEAYQQMKTAREPVLFPAYISGCRSLNLNLFPEGGRAHRLVMTECAEAVTDGDLCLMRQLAVYLEGALSHLERGSGNDALNLIFKRLLSDRTADYVEVSQSLSEAGWSSRHAYLCLVLKMEFAEQKELTTKNICHHIRRQYADSASFPYAEEIVCFFNLTKLELDEGALAQSLTNFIRDSILKAGYSRVLCGHMNLRRQYVQAKAALEVGDRKCPYRWIHRFNQVALPYIFEQSTRKLPGQMLCHERLLQLKQLDEQRGTEYMETLRVYLQENLNATQTANALYIHRSTFLYRLEKIKSILQSDLEDAEEIFYLNLSFRLLDAEAKKIF